MRKPIVLGVGTLCIVGSVMALSRGWLAPPRPVGDMSYANPSSMAKWPLPGGKTDTLRPGITHTFAQATDGTQIDFFDFDFKANPKLRFEIFDQDEDDAKPLDGKVLHLPRNVALATKQLNARGRGPVVAAWNGAFFGYDFKAGAENSFHVSPVVLRGKVLYNTANHRWTWGVKQTPQGPVWKTFFKPSRQIMEREFDYAAGSVQCLIKDGKPLEVEPFPLIGQGFKPQPVPSSAEEAGHIPSFDHMRTCRASIGWSRDNQHLYLLTVEEPDSENGSNQALIWAVRGEPIPGNITLTGGWTVPDLQRFWISKGVWGAINSDAGSAFQLVYRHPKANYTFLPPRLASEKMRIEYDPTWKGSFEGGGTIMYFMVREE
ncbi:hypothetical protein EON80_07095 [bacterium]|nr:MAG: hypothetical protein EON80_07095 [bacterium]